MSIDSMSDTGAAGLIFRSSFIQEISPSIKQEKAGFLQIVSPF
jgi:hypothetical protein